MSFLAGKRSGIFQMPLPKKRRLEAAATSRRTNPLTDALALPTLSALGITPQDHTTA